MPTTARETAAEDARAVAAAARSLARALRAGEDPTGTTEWVEVQAVRAVGTRVHGFDAGSDAPQSDDETLALAVSQLGIGLTLLSAESAVAGGGTTDQLEAAAEELDRTADTVESTGAARAVHGFDASAADGTASTTSVVDAALSALDAMTTAATDVLTTLWDRTAGALLKKLPDPVPDLVKTFELELPGRLARLGLRAVRRALDLLLSLVDLPAVERFRDDVDGLVERMGAGGEVSVLVGAAIGADRARAAVAQVPRDAPGPAEDDPVVVAALTRLVEGFARLCAALRTVGGLLLGLSGVLALLGVTLPQAQLVGAAGLVLVVAAVVALGRDHTGATDLPGRVQGVQLLVLGGRAT